VQFSSYTSKPATSSCCICLKNTCYHLNSLSIGAYSLVLSRSRHDRGSKYIRMSYGRLTRMGYCHARGHTAVPHCRWRAVSGAERICRPHRTLPPLLLKASSPAHTPTFTAAVLVLPREFLSIRCANNMAVAAQDNGEPNLLARSAVVLTRLFCVCSLPLFALSFPSPAPLPFRAFHLRVSSRPLCRPSVCPCHYCTGSDRTLPYHRTPP
jgi:hypothetical protein